MDPDSCIFCKIVKGQIPAVKVYEDDVVVAFLDIGPVSDGHTLVIPKQHFEKIDQCPDELLGVIFSGVGKVAKAVKSGIECDGYNVLCNNGRAAGQLVDHLHFHIVPRINGDGVFDHWPSYKYPDGRAEEIAGKIIENL